MIKTQSFNGKSHDAVFKLITKWIKDTTKKRANMKKNSQVQSVSHAITGSSEYGNPKAFTGSCIMVFE